MKLEAQITNRQSTYLELLVIIGISIVPLFFNFPYRVNIFLSWEGAYRLYSGQLPYRDFGMPMGFTYWLIPTAFFKLFGPYLFSLVKAQVFINIISGLSFRSIMHSLRIENGVRLISVVVFCLSFSFFNFWPWYNHTVIVFQIAGIALLLKYLCKEDHNKFDWIYIALAGIMTFITLFTKQDAGGLALMIQIFLLVIHYFYIRSLYPIGLFLSSYIITAACFILPFLQYDFLYWFNYGQEPHNSRLTVVDFIETILGKSQWIKFYLFIIALLFWHDLKERILVKNRLLTLTYAVVISILLEALLFQVTSYTPPDNNIFFHSFAVFIILSRLPLNIDFTKWKVFFPVVLFIFFWFSGTYWKYLKRLADRHFPALFNSGDPSKVSIRTYAQGNDDNLPPPEMDKWKPIDLKPFEHMYLPKETVEGINRLLAKINVNEQLQVLNMTELTPLAAVIGYELKAGTPLWYHKGVSIFDKEIMNFQENIKSGTYDLVLFEDIPDLNNFYPDEIHQTLRSNYLLIDKFRAPRRKASAQIYVYVKNDSL